MQVKDKLIKRIEFTEQEFLDKLCIKGKLGFIFHSSLDKTIIFDVEDDLNDENKEVVL